MFTIPEIVTSVGARLNGLKVGRHYTVVVVRQRRVNVIDDTRSNLITLLALRMATKWRNVFQNRFKKIA